MASGTCRSFAARRFKKYRNVELIEAQDMWVVRRYGPGICPSVVSLMRYRLVLDVM
jgi:hypothetical protein